MSSISITAFTATDKDEPVPVVQQPADMGGTKPARPARSGAPTVVRSAKGEKTVANANKAAGSKSAVSGVTKTEIVLKKLRMAKGATIAQLGEATGWQAHSVRGFLSAVVRKKLGLNLVSEIGKDGQRRYRIIDSEGGATGEPG